MKRELTVQIGADGVLHLHLPFGLDDANKTMRVVVETLEDYPQGRARTQEEWQDFVQRVAGGISDPTFERHPQGD